jgi:hypothetical protein
MKQFIYPAAMLNDVTSVFIAPTATVVAPTPIEIATVPTKAIESKRQLASINISGKFMLVGKSGKPFNGYVDLVEGKVKTSFNGKIVSAGKIANGTFLTADGGQLQIFRSTVTDFKTKEESLALPVKKATPVKRKSAKMQLADLMEANNKLLAIVAAQLGQAKA